MQLEFDELAVGYGDAAQYAIGERKRISVVFAAAFDVATRIDPRVAGRQGLKRENVRSGRKGSGRA
ncbi:MAG: hypothetical protein JOY59_05430 [Candidatus Eremiobacteraeota bacterium]|nr:hypothetical protein [Candidatus Eremiobacteraeota bacterium]